MKILGLDLSTTVCGICVLNENKEIQYLSYFKFISKEMLEKGVELKNLLDSLMTTHNFTHFYIEERLQGFRAGGTNAEAMGKTAALSFLCQYMIYEFGINPETINVNAARALAFPKFHKFARTQKGTKHKELIFKFVCETIGAANFPTKIMKSGVRKGQTVFIDEAMDMSDAWVIATAGINKLNK